MFISSRMPPTAAPRPRSTGRRKTAPGDDEPLSNSNCLERLHDFQLKMHRVWVGEGGWARLHYVSTIPLTFRASEQCGFLLPSPANDNELKTANIIRIKELYNIWNKTIRHHKTSLVSPVLFSGIFTIVICTRKMIMIVIFLVVDPITCFTLL